MLVVFGEDAVMEAAFAELAVHEPEPAQVVAQLFAEAPFAALAIEGGQDASLEQLFGRDAGATRFLVERVEEGRETLKDGIDLSFDGAQGVAGGHAGVEGRMVRDSGWG